MDKKNALKILTAYLNWLKQNDYAVRKAYLFGSYARGGQHEDSDMDIAIVLENVKSLMDAQFELMKLRRKFDTRIEPHPFAEADFDMSNPFANEIIRTGIRIL